MYLITKITDTLPQYPGINQNIPQTLDFWNWDTAIENIPAPTAPMERKHFPFPQFNLTTIDDTQDLKVHPDTRIMDAAITILLTTAFQLNLNRDNIDAQYRTFTIPKHDGGSRLITAPSPTLKAIQKDFADILVKNLRMLPHNAVHSYTEGRGIRTAVQSHQLNQSRWFLKLDIHNFFPSITLQRLRNNLIHYAQYNHWRRHSNILPGTMEDFLALMMYNSGLPQGSPASPALSNFYLIDFDVAFTEWLKAKNNHFCYTRYADDLLISAPTRFDSTEIIDFVVNSLHDNYRLTLNTNKIRFGSSSGRNWNLGLMLNKDNNITIGHEKKQRLKSDIYNFLKDYNTMIGNDEIWLDFEQRARRLFGQISHFKNIEPDYATFILTKYERQFNITFEELYKMLT